MRALLFHPVHWARAITITALIVVCVFSCKKSNPTSPTPPPPTSPQVATAIYNISPSSGPDSTIVTITGAGFSTNSLKDSVKFNGIPATVKQASASQLTVIVPLRAGTGSVSLKVDTQSVKGPTFTYIYTTLVTTIAGNGVAGYADGAGTTAEFRDPDGVAVDTKGNIYV